MAKKRSFNPEKDLLLEQEFQDLENDLKPRKPSVKEKVAGKMSAAAQNLLVALKFVLGLCLLPFVFSSTEAFLSEFSRIDPLWQRYFWAGVVTFLLAHLFIWEPSFLYSLGQKVLGALFSFFTPLVKVAPSVVPIYVLIVFMVYGILSVMIKDAWLSAYCMFAAGFFVSLHLVFSARSVKTKKGDFLKANYIFSFSFIYIMNLILLAFCLHLAFREFSSMRFFAGMYEGAQSVLSAIFSQLFTRA